MHKSTWLRILFLVLIYGIVNTACGDKLENETPPNIIIVLADDLGYGDISINVPNNKIKTPHIDRIAQEGLHFTDAHTPSSVCTPTRYGLLTGRYNWRSRLKNGGAYRKIQGTHSEFTKYDSFHCSK